MFKVYIPLKIYCSEVRTMTTKDYNMGQLSFGMDRILSKEFAPGYSEKSRICAYPLYPVTYSYSGTYGSCDFQHHNYMNLPYLQQSETRTIASLSKKFGTLHASCNKIVRPAPVRLLPTDTVQASASSTCQTEGNPDGRRKSWSRAVFSSLQRKGLEKRFAIQKYITKPDRRILASSLGLTDAQVKVWFQNRRMKWRHTKEAEKAAESQASVDCKDELRSLIKDNVDSKISEDEDIDIEVDA